MVDFFCGRWRLFRAVKNRYKYLKKSNYEIKKLGIVLKPIII